MTKDTWTYKEISSTHLSILRWVAFIPFEGQNLNSIGTRLLSVYYHVMNTIVNTMFSAKFVKMIVFKSFSFDVDYFSELLPVQGVCIRYLLIYLNRKELTKLVRQCKDLWSYLTVEESRTVRDFERKAYYFRSFMFVNTIVVITIFIITAQFIRLPPATVNGTERRMLPFRFYVDVQEEPMFTVVSIFQAVVCYTVPMVIGGIDTASLYLIMMACGYLRSLQNRLLSMSKGHDGVILNNHNKAENDEYKNEIILKNLLTCIQFHQKVMLFCQEIELFARRIFFVTVFTTVYNMSITGIKILENDEQKFKFYGLLIFNLFQFFICQWGPEYLLIESEEIGEAAYFASWGHSSYHEKTNRMLLFIMLRAQRPIQLTAGGYIDLSIETFGTMVKNAFSFFAVLRSFNN